MIVQPTFLEHWKTRLLVEITSDASAPLAVIRLWGYCQESHRWEFPGMSPTQLASICRWGARKPPCHVALVKCGFVDKLPGGGFAAHDWGEHNSRLVHNWEAGKKGGRPNDLKKSNKDGPNDETLGLALGSPRKTHKIGLDRMGDEEKGKGCVPSEVVPPGQPPQGTHTKASGEKPDLELVKLRAAGENIPAECAEKWFYEQEGRAWTDRAGQPIRDWRASLKAFALGWEQRERNRQGGHGANGTKPSQAVSPSVQAMLDQKELERVEKAIAGILNSYESHQPLSIDDKVKLKPLRERREILKRQLGFTA